MPASSIEITCRSSSSTPALLTAAASIVGVPLERIAAAVKSAGVDELLRHVISIEDAGIYKPHRTVYELATRRLQLPPERICFVSSNGWDAAGAAHFGYRAVWANRGGQPRERIPGVLAAEIVSLDQLPSLLGL